MSQADERPTTIPTRRALLAGTPAAAAAALAAGTAVSGLAIARATPSEPDPIFAAIAEHRAAVKAYIAASQISANLENHTPDWNAAEAVTQAAIKRDHAAAYAIASQFTAAMLPRAAFPWRCWR